jgi:hypothetical protein
MIAKLMQALKFISTLWIAVALTHSGVAQNPATSARAEMQSDPAAVQIFRSVLQQSGGIDTWKGIRSMEIRVSFVVPGKPNPVNLLMLDDWSTKATIYRRGFVGLTTTPRDHNGAPAFNTKKNGTGKTVQEFDQARVLADHVPAAAIEVILRRPDYVVKQSDSDKCPNAQQCLDVYRQNIPNGPFVKEQHWIISTSNGLPTKVKLRLPSLLQPSREIWEEVSYNNYAPNNGLTVPTDVEINMGAGMRQRSHLEAMTPGVVFDAKHFDQELAR